MSALLIVTGCGGGGGASKPSAGPKEVNADDLPKLGEYLKPPIDVDRLEVAPPAGWNVGTATTRSLARFSRFEVKSARLPSIHVMAEDSPFEDFPNVPRERLKEFADAMVDLVNERENSSAILESVKPMIIGDNPCVRYVKKARFTFTVPVPKKVDGEVQVLMTLINDRMYTVHLRVLNTEQLTKYRDHAYAVMAGLKPAGDSAGTSGKAKPESAKSASSDKAKKSAKNAGAAADKKTDKKAAGKAK